MLDLFTMLPFLKGWKWVILEKNATVQVGQNQIIIEEDVEQGWLVSADLNTTDLFTNIAIKFPPSDFLLQTTIQLESTYNVVLPMSPGSQFYMTTINQPNPYSSVGFFSLAYASPALPFPPKTNMQVIVNVPANTAAAGALPNGSTQQSITLFFGLVFIKVVDTEEFLKSLKDVFGIGGVE